MLGLEDAIFGRYRDVWLSVVTDGVGGAFLTLNKVLQRGEFDPPNISCPYLLSVSLEGSSQLRSSFPVLQHYGRNIPSTAG